jgi:hypothetical protein
VFSRDFRPANFCWIRPAGNVPTCPAARREKRPVLLISEGAAACRTAIPVRGLQALDNGGRSLSVTDAHHLQAELSAGGLQASEHLGHQAAAARRQGRGDGGQFQPGRSARPCVRRTRGRAGEGTLRPRSAYRERLIFSVPRSLPPRQPPDRSGPVSAHCTSTCRCRSPQRTCRCRG